MSVRGAMLWVILAGLLGGLLLFVRARDGSADQQGSFLLGLDSASVVGLRVEKGPGQTESLTRGSSGDWVIEGPTNQNDSSELYKWPAQDSRVRGGIRLLASSEFGPREPEKSTEGSASIGSLVIQLRGGLETEIVFESRGVGGRVPVRINSGTVVRHGWADRGLLESYLETGLMQWRDRSLWGSAMQAESITIEALGERVGLRRVGGRWVIQEPVSIEADPEVVETVLSELNEMAIERFLDDADPLDKAYGLTTPVGFIELGWPSRGPNGQKASRRVSLGARADASGEVLHAQAEWLDGQNTFGPQVLTVRVPEFPISAATYLRKQASSLSQSDVRGVMVRRRTDNTAVSGLTRTVDGWELDGEPDRDGVGDALSEFVCSRPADLVEFISSAELSETPGFLGEFGLIVGSGVEAEVFSVALPTPESPMLRLIGGDLGEANHAVWSFGGPDADTLVAWFVLRFGI